MSGGITAVAPATGEYFHASKSYFWGRSKWTSFKTPTNPHQISSIKKDPMLEEELFARVLECIFFDQFYPLWLQDGTADTPPPPPPSLGLRR